MCAHLCAGVHVEGRGQLQMSFLQLGPPWSFEMGSASGLEFTSSDKSGASPRDPSVFKFPMLGLCVPVCVQLLNVGAGN